MCKTVHIIPFVLLLKGKEKIHTHAHYCKCIKISGRLPKKALTMIFLLGRKTGVGRVRNFEYVFLDCQLLKKKQKQKTTYVLF